MRRRDLEIVLQSIQRLEEYDVTLEQYPTPAEVVASILYSAQMEHEDIGGKTVCDLGCGDGIFALGAALLGADKVIGIDIQSKALKVSQRNSLLLGTEDQIDWVLGNVSSFQLSHPVDTVVSNPPFGVKQRGADLGFLTTALAIAQVTYSIHLSSEKNRAFLKRSIESLGGAITQIESFEFPIQKIYRFHRKRIHRITVDLYRIEVTKK